MLAAWQFASCSSAAAPRTTPTSPPAATATPGIQPTFTPGTTQPIKLPFTYAGHSGAVFAAAWSPDGKRVASGGDDLGLQVWNATTGSLYYIAYGHKNVDGGGILSAAWSPDGTRIASGGVDATVQVIDAATRGHIATYSGQTDWIFGLAWSPDGSEIVSAGQDNTVQIWLPH